MENKQKIYVSRAGYQQYLEALKISKEKYNEYLKTRTDYGSNSVDDYKTAVYDSDLSLLRNAVDSLTESIEHLVIIENENAEEGLIGLDDIVTIHYNDTDDLRVVKLSGGMPVIEAKDDIHTITINSPLGKAIYKKSVGDTVSFNVGKNTITIDIISKEKTTETPAPEKQ